LLKSGFDLISVIITSIVSTTINNSQTRVGLKVEIILDTAVTVRPSYNEYGTSANQK